MSKEQLKKENQKKQTTSLSKGFFNEQIKLIVEKNPWLLKMDYVDLNPEGALPACWDGDIDYSNPFNLCVVFDCHFTVGWVFYSIDVRDGHIGSDGNQICSDNKPTEIALQHFVDWTRPTQEENDYFAMIYGHRLPWSKEEPFVV